MTDDQDARLTELLRADAPAERDALFRLDVLERREQLRFRRKVLLLLAAALVTLVLLALGADWLGEQTLAPAGMLILGIGVILATIVYGRILLHHLRRLHHFKL